jgi:hypothetical protein
MKNSTLILTLLKKVIYKLDRIEERLAKLEQISNFTPTIPYSDSRVVTKLNYYVGDNSNCPQCLQDLSKNPVCNSVNCPYACKVTC